MSQIDKFSRQEKRTKIVGPVEADPEYNCIVESNNLIVEIDNEIGTCSSKTLMTACF